MHAHLLLVPVPDRQCRHCVAWAVPRPGPTFNARVSGWPRPTSDWNWGTLLLSDSLFGDSPAPVTHVLLAFLVL